MADDDLIQRARQRKVERASALPGNEDLVERWTAALGADPASADADETDEAGDGLDSLTKAELLDRATDANIEGRSTMSKAELLDALRGEA